MNVTFGALDAFAFVVFAVILLVAVVIVVSLESSPDNSRESGDILRPLR